MNVEMLWFDSKGMLDGQSVAWIIITEIKYSEEHG